MKLDEVEKLLQTKGFDTSVADEVVGASQENPDCSVEFTIDSEGWCLVKKTAIKRQSSKPILALNQKISKVHFSSETSQIRIKLSSIEDLLEVLKMVDLSRF
jgi:hypothetical protein